MSESVAVLVAHPDDETLWAGGTLMLHPEWECWVCALCRGGDADRAPKFFRTLETLSAEGAMADLDDGPDQVPLPQQVLHETLLSLLPARSFRRVLTHAPWGEYTRHLRHEEVSRAVLHLWRDGRIRAGEVWLFAYDDGAKAFLPRPSEGADLRVPLPDEIWARKRSLITGVYGFREDSWEALATPREEAFWLPEGPDEAAAWSLNPDISPGIVAKRRRLPRMQGKRPRPPEERRVDPRMPEAPERPPNKMVGNKLPTLRQGWPTEFDEAAAAISAVAAGYWRDIRAIGGPTP